MPKLSIHDVDENLDDMLSDFGLGMLNDLKTLKLSPSDLTSFLTDNYEEIVEDTRARLYIINKSVFIKKLRLPFQKLSKSDGLRAILLVDQQKQMSIFPIQIYSAKKKPKHAKQEEAKYKAVIEHYVKEFMGGN